MGGLIHMSHPFDDNDLTFGDLKNIITLGLGGKLDREDGVTEKLDGQNLMLDRWWIKSFLEIKDIWKTKDATPNTDGIKKILRSWKWKHFKFYEGFIKCLLVPSMHKKKKYSVMVLNGWI